MKTPTIADMLLHSLSLQIATAYHVAREIPLTTEAKDDLIMAFRNVRRHINKDEDGDRFGSFSAFQAMQGLVG